MLAKLAKLITARRELLDLIAGLERVQADGHRVQVEAVRAAVEQAGGVDVVVDALRSVRLLDGVHLQADEEHGQLLADEVALERERVEAQARLDKLTMGNTQAPRIDGYAARLEASAAELADRIDQIRKRIDQRQTQEIGAMVAQAIAADEPARVAIEAAAAKTPEVFMAGFPTAIRQSNWLRHRRRALALLLSWPGEGPPSRGVAGPMTQRPPATGRPAEAGPVGAVEPIRTRPDSQSWGQTRAFLTIRSERANHQINR